MLIDVVEVKALSGTTVFLKFEDGTAGEVDLSELVEFTGVFESLRDPAEFAKVQVHRELGTIFWPNGADLDPDVLHAALTGESIDIPATEAIPL
jgi:hypothetical protein